MSVNSPIWYRILEHFERKNYFQNGLTIPFLIGGEKLINPANDISAIGDFISDISNSTEVRVTTIMMCGNIGEYIIGLEDEETKAMRQIYPNLYKEFGSLICTDQSFDDADDLNELITIVEARYTACLSSALFSKNHGIWTEFSTSDISRLQELQ